MARVHTARRHLAADAALAAVVIAVGQLEVWAPEVMHPGNLSGPEWIISVGYFAVGVAAYSERRRALAGLALVLVGLVLHEAFDPLNRDVLNLAGAIPFDLAAVAAWLGDAYARTRRLYVAELRDRAERAEREREERVRSDTAQERARIARELHDAVAYTMSVIVVQAEAAEEVLGPGSERARVPLQRIQRLGREGLAEMRRLLGVLGRTSDRSSRHNPAWAPWTTSSTRYAP